VCECGCVAESQDDDDGDVAEEILSNLQTNRSSNVSYTKKVTTGVQRNFAKGHIAPHTHFCTVHVFYGWRRSLHERS